MMWSYGRGPLAAVLIGTAALTAAPLRAQEQAESEAVDLAPLVVESEGERADGPVEGHFAKRSATATKTDTPIMETPQSISVISSGDMSARGARSLAQA
ncbi:MAG: TonB-dependent siderophore receptor, partial [Parvibaculum sp.]|nr:TonB-dependent siderophore receptor [Parvibaculum sp.]